ncbi:MAG: WbuC family cupin fold metalloprotein [Bacteroidales bacterium]|nr:WbuC family cupin fold metalloprotein [Bacteroidales bacterium]
MNFDMRNSAEEAIQCMLNAIESGTIMPIHGHVGFSEICLCVRGHFLEYFYDEKGNVTTPLICN